MTVIPTWLVVLSTGKILLMVAYGTGSFTRQDLTSKLTGHTITGAADIVGAAAVMLCCFYYSFHTTGAS